MSQYSMASPFYTVVLPMATPAQVQAAEAARNKSRCEQSIAMLRSIIINKGINVQFDPIQYFFHVTNMANRISIESNGGLKRSIANLRFGSEGSPIDGRLEGVFFCCTLFRGGLPDRSPYGTERICIPVEYFLNGNPHLFYNSYHEVPGNPVNPVPVHYVVLVLVKDDDPEFSFCEKNLEELPMNNNSFLIIDSLGKRYGCFSNQTCYQQFKLYVEVFVIGDVRLPLWNQVIKTGRHQ